MKIGLYFGSFNPIHHGHLIVASHVLQNEDVDQVWFVVSPQNPFKTETALLNEYHRLHLTRLAIEGEVGFRVTDIEFKLPRPSYTFDTLEKLDERYPEFDFSIIMGSDSFLNIDKWKRSKEILERRRVIVYERNGFPVRTDIVGDIHICKAPMLNISASLIRRIIGKGQSIRYYVPEKVLEEIESGRYYR
jgi:nicotinate-nucleotide adenylyltransferase